MRRYAPEDDSDHGSPTRRDHKCDCILNEAPRPSSSAYVITKRTSTSGLQVSTTPLEEALCHRDNRSKGV